MKDRRPSTIGQALPFFVAHASPRILMGCLAAALVARITVGGYTLADGVALLALLLYWPLNEWLIHVFILHRKPTRWFGREIDLAVSRKHRAHHRDPRNIGILFMPLHSFLFTLPALLLLSFGLAPTSGLALTIVCGVLALGLHYEWIHFLAHTRYVPRTRPYRRAIRNHRLHHFKNEHYWFGVSMVGADAPLGTSPRHQDVDTSPTCRTLGVPEREPSLA